MGGRFAVVGESGIGGVVGSVKGLYGLRKVSTCRCVVWLRSVVGVGGVGAVCVVSVVWDGDAAVGVVGESVVGGVVGSVKG